MNKRQKLVQERFLDNEEAVIKQLEKVYETALTDITKKSQTLYDDINRLDALAKLATDDDEKAQILSQKQAKVYQKQYQDALKKQVSGILDNMQVEEFKTVSSYLQTCYEDAFVGTMFDLQGQGIPLCFPIDQESMVRAVQLDSKISEGLYNAIGENVADLKKHITSEVARGIATGASFSDIARQLRTRMTGDGYDKAGGKLYRSKLIARTEGHRIQVQATMDACHKAKEKGADVVKQWDATLDAKTRDSHAQVDGEIRELDKPFSNGLMFPGDPDGGAAEVCNCRCALLQRARWALDEDELKTLQDRAEHFGLDKSEQFEEYKKNYLKASEVLTNTDNNVIVKKGFKEVETDTSKALKKLGVEYNAVVEHSHALTTDEIVSLVAGGDLTTGSCASAALAYAGQKQGWNVLDFRGGSSMDFFSSKANKIKMFKDLGATSLVSDSGKSNLTNGKRILGQLSEGAEYYLSVGRHAAIVRKKEGVLQYLELQCSKPDMNGWKNFGDVAYTLKYRFGCSTSSRYYPTAYATDISQLTGDDFRTILGYMNTDGTSQRKGAAGSAK